MTRKWQEVMPSIPLEVGVPVLWDNVPFVVTAIISEQFVVVIRSEETVDPMHTTRVLTEAKDLQINLNNPIGLDYARRWSGALPPPPANLKLATANACTIALRMMRGKMS